ncbi:Zinc finger, RanBP2-type [Artemisia annua]|uniref:Zinc finger, RanBP2-type n=1 Tax=Artemisia annua TaxID=35608 RepID=A0A2U1QDA8_ARTAN|nr:Zinc finger, RanBP2-type [Artemisia annua]
MTSLWQHQLVPDDDLLIGDPLPEIRREIGALLYDHVIALKFNSSVSFSFIRLAGATNCVSDIVELAFHVSELDLCRTGSVLPQCCWMRILQLTQLFCESVKKAVGERIVPTIDHQKPNHTKAQWGPRPGFFPEEPSQKKDGTRENDWECPKCGNVNFSFRTVCNMRKCNTLKPGSQVAKPAKSSKADMPEGSWKCDKCNNINYPFRTKCNRQNCGADKPLESQNSPTEEENNDQDMFKKVQSCRPAVAQYGSESQSCRRRLRLPVAAVIDELLG